MRVIIDIRERDLYAECERLLSGLTKATSVTLERDQLALGDILLTSEEGQRLVLIERKTFQDMMASIKDNRYKEQSHRLLHLQEYPPHSIFYLLEGGFHQLYSPIEKKIMYSSIASLQMFKGFSVFRTISLTETAEWIISLATKMDTNKEKQIQPYFLTPSYLQSQQQPIPSTAEDGKEGQPPQVQSHPTDYVQVVKKVKKDNICRENIGEIMLSQIPGISSNTAIGIMKYFDSFPDMVHKINENPALLDEIMLETNGKKRKLGKNCTQNIRAFLQR
jgi:ERCC4-type nuclease